MLMLFMASTGEYALVSINESREPDDHNQMSSSDGKHEMSRAAPHLSCPT